MNFDECIRFATEHPICAVATVDDDQPRVRMLGMWFAANEGFYFSTAKVKAMCRQLTANHKVELVSTLHRDARPAREEQWT
jgi:pyridoxamine 5'-phosphate oxidase